MARPAGRAFCLSAGLICHATETEALESARGVSRPQACSKILITRQGGYATGQQSV